MGKLTYTPGGLLEKNLYMCKVSAIRLLTQHTYVMRFDRNGLQFKAGQYVTVGLQDSLHHREYSIYSGENDNYLEIMVREVLEGNISLQLKYVKMGQFLEVSGPMGLLTLNETDIRNRKFVLIATGTGIAPFHSFIKSYPEMDYMLIHGVRYLNESYECGDYDAQRYILCTSGEKSHNFHGRVTGCLEKMKVDPEALYYTCGNSHMIHDVYEILRKKGVAMENIRSEVYF